MFLPLATTILAAATATAEPVTCTYEHTAPISESGRTQYIFLNECGFYEVGYRLDGNTLHFPRGGTHVVKDMTEADAQALLVETYGLVDAGGETLVRTKNVLASRN